MLKGVPRAPCTLVKPASDRTAFNRFSPACAPSASPTSWLRELGRADHCREPIRYPSDRIEVLSKRISREGLHNHEGPIRVQASPDLAWPRRQDRPYRGGRRKSSQIHSRDQGNPSPWPHGTRRSTILAPCHAFSPQRLKPGDCQTHRTLISETPSP